ISGASSGIGWATAQRFAAGGDRVFNLDVQAPADPQNPAVQWIETDVADWSAVRDAVTQVAETAPIDVVIANAGISVRHGVLDLSEADARRVIDVNLLGVLGLWQAAARVMVRQRAGVLLATASVNGARGYPLYADYNATKAGIVALCRTFALELSPWIRVACVSPGAVLTPMQLAEYTPAMLDEVNAKIPAGRHASPDEIAAAFHYLASPEASFLTGQELVIDGAETAGATTAVFGADTSERSEQIIEADAPGGGTQGGAGRREQGTTRSGVPA
ncbi:SDR family NAD(P)-dependent oxidoreductase, partial [Verrucosispora sp. NA02020]|uniref:SDR family NAD(P)-dependent oxidoreductase n=2 Tax=Micromonospora TaxID=1873 RepID=UPI003D7186CB